MKTAVPPASPAPEPVRAATVQRKCACGNSAGPQDQCEECEKKKYLQRRATGPGGQPAAAPSVRDALAGPSQPLDTKTRADLEPRFGHDFGNVRVHTGSHAAESARSMNALAYTAGRDVVFGEGQYAPETPAGRNLLAHELTHVVQQQSMDAPGVQPKLEVGAADTPLEKQADQAAARATGGLIVDDSAGEVSPGQMRKSEFLDQLRSAACAAADGELRAVGKSTEGCPYIERMIARYEARGAADLERAIRLYAPATAGVAAAPQYIPLVTERIRGGVARWATTGQVTGVPPELAAEMPGGGAMGAIGGAVASALGAVGRLFAKPREGGVRNTGSAAPGGNALGRGSALESGVRSRMESAFGHDFSRVRVHAGSEAAGLSGHFNARAFTVGSDIAFGAGEYRPGTLIGDALIAHELAHVVQQGDAKYSFQASSSEYKSLEDDADVSAVSAMASVYGKGKGAAAPHRRSALRLQRCGGAGTQEPAAKAGETGKGRLIDDPQLKAVMAKMWTASVANALEPTEFSITVIRNTNTGALRVDSRQGRPIRLGERGMTKLCDPKLQLKAGEVAWGTVHTHPLPPTEGIQEPNPDDQANVARILADPDMRARCGTEHYVISDDAIYSYDGSTYTKLGSRKEILGE